MASNNIEHGSLEPQSSAFNNNSHNNLSSARLSRQSFLAGLGALGLGLYGLNRLAPTERAEARPNSLVTLYFKEKNPITQGPLTESASSQDNNGIVRLAGGYTNQNGSTIHLEYNPQADTYTSRKPLTIARESARGAIRQDSRFWVTGGDNFASGLLDSVEVYNPLTDTWSTGPQLPFPITLHEASNDQSNLIHVLGGQKGALQSATHLRLKADETGWDTLSDLPYPVMQGAGAQDKITGKMYIAGGIIGNELATDNILCIDNGNVTILPYKLKQSIYNGSAVILGNKLIISGGNVFGTGEQNITQIVDLSTGIVDYGTDLPTVRESATAAVLNSTTAILIGGTGGKIGGPNQGITLDTSLEMSLNAPPTATSTSIPSVTPTNTPTSTATPLKTATPSPTSTPNLPIQGGGTPGSLPTFRVSAPVVRVQN